MFLCMKRNRSVHTPEFVIKGVDIHVDKTVKEYFNGTKFTTTYEAYVYSRDEKPMPIRHLGEWPTEEDIAKRISEYVNGIRQRFSFPEFDYRINQHNMGYVATRTCVTEEEGNKIAKSIEELLK